MWKPSSPPFMCSQSFCHIIHRVFSLGKTLCTDIHIAGSCWLLIVLVLSTSSILQWLSLSPSASFLFLMLVNSMLHLYFLTLLSLSSSSETTSHLSYKERILQAASGKYFMQQSAKMRLATMLHFCFEEYNDESNNGPCYNEASSNILNYCAEGNAH